MPDEPPDLELEAAGPVLGWRPRGSAAAMQRLHRDYAMLGMRVVDLAAARTLLQVEGPTDEPFREEVGSERDYALQHPWSKSVRGTATLDPPNSLAVIGSATECRTLTARFMEGRAASPRTHSWGSLNLFFAPDGNRDACQMWVYLHPDAMRPLWADVSRDRVRSLTVGIRLVDGYRDGTTLARWLKPGRSAGASDVSLLHLEFATTREGAGPPA